MANIGDQIIIDFGQDEQGYWHWRCGNVEGGPYRTAEEAERAATAKMLPPGAKIINEHRESFTTKH